MTPTLIIELTAAAFGVLGTVLLALNGPRAGWGFVAFLASNAGWIAFAWIHAHWGMLAQQLAFTVSALLGVWVWLVKPLRDDWPMGLCFGLWTLSDVVFRLALQHPRLSKVLHTLPTVIDELALRIYRRCKPEGMVWNFGLGQWEKKA